MAIALLATGDEIVHGDTLNTNAYVLAQALSSEGLPLGMHVSCSDKEQDLVDCLQFLAAHHKIIISIGGLGPTSDDITRFAFARFFDLELVEYPEALEHIQSRLKRANLPFDSGNRQQALFPVDATVLPNPNGTAMGCIFWAQERLCVFLPGPPRECLPMFDAYVLPRLQQTQHSQKQLLSWQLFGVSEGQMAEKLERALAGLGCKLGYRLDMPYLEFKVFCCETLVEKVKAIVDPLVTAYCISPPKQKASQLLRDRLIANPSMVLVIADKATGGTLESLLRVPATESSLCFHPSGGAIQFEIEGLDTYWHSGEQLKTDLLIKYKLGSHHGFERHSLPYRGTAYALGYAAEWLCFRMLHLLDQIH